MFHGLSMEKRVTALDDAASGLCFIKETATQKAKHKKKNNRENIKLLGFVE